MTAGIIGFIISSLVSAYEPFNLEDWADQVTTQIAEHSTEIQSCYTNLLKKQKPSTHSISGEKIITVEIRMSINKKGKLVKLVPLKSTKKFVSQNRCLLKIASKIKFAKPPHTQQIEQVLNLHLRPRKINFAS